MSSYSNYPWYSCPLALGGGPNLYHPNPFFSNACPPVPPNPCSPLLPSNPNPLLIPSYYPGYNFGSQPLPLNTCPPQILNIANPLPLSNYYSGFSFGCGVGVGTVADTNQTSTNPPNSSDQTSTVPSPPSLNFNLGPVAGPWTGSSFSFGVGPGACLGHKPITFLGSNHQNPCQTIPPVMLNCNPCHHNHCSHVCVSTCVCTNAMICGPNFTNSGNSKYSSGEILPTEIIDSADDKDWQAMVNDFSQRGKFKNCLAVCDVSGSMTGTPMDVCVALGLLVAELCEVPWKGKVVTYNTAPELLTIEGKSIQEKKDWMIKMPWTEELDLKKVFEKIIELAEKENLSKQKMIKRLFIFTDLEFDKSAGQTWVSDYKEIQNMYNLAGYSGMMPEIVFWNIHEEKATVKTGSRNGVEILSGYSKSFMKLFMKNDGMVDLEAIMARAAA